MFTTDLDRLPPEERIEQIEALEKQIQKGTYNPIPECEKVVRYRAKNEYRQTVTIGLPLSFVGAISLGAILAVPSFFVGVIGAGGLLGSIAFARLRLNQKLRDLKSGEWGDYLTDDELEKLDDYQKKITPTTEDAKYAQKLIKSICDELLEDEEEGETIDAKAEEVKDKEGDPRETIKTPDNPVETKDKSLDTENFVKPAVWLDSPAPEPVTDSLGAPIGLNKKMAELEEKQADDFVFLAKDITDLKEGFEEIKQLLRKQPSVSQTEEQTENRKNLDPLPRSPGQDRESVRTSVRAPVRTDPGTPSEEPVFVISNLGVKPEFKPAQDITGWTIEDFRREIPAGTINPYDCVKSPVVKRKAINLVYECQDQFDRNSPEFAVWYVFGIKRSATSKEYKSTSVFCKKCIDYWKKELRGN